MLDPRSLRATFISICLLALPAPAQEAEQSFGWQDVSYGLQSTRITAVAVPPDRQNVVYAAAQGELYVSTDAGVTWERLLIVNGTGVGAGREDEGITQQELADIEEEARAAAVEEFTEEVREDIIDDLEDELGRDLAEEIADDTAEELAEDLLDEGDVDERLREEIERRIADRQRGDDEAIFGEATGELAEAVEDSPDLGPDTIFRLEVGPGGRILVASANGLYVSTDGGATFDNAQVALGAEAREVRVARWDPHDPKRIYVGTADGFYFSPDDGQSWLRSVGPVDRGVVNDIAIDPRTPETLLAATSMGIYRSTDGAITFEEIWAPVGEDLGNVRAVAFDGGLPGHVYAGSAAGLLLSLDRGESFGLVVPAGLTSQDITDVDTWSERPGAVVVATASGIFASVDGAEQFVNGYPGLPARIVNRVATRPRYPEVFAATGSGLFVWQKLDEPVPEPVWVQEVVRSAPPLPYIVEAASSYAAVDPNWFGRLHRRASMAWVLPQVSAAFRVNYERDEGNDLEAPAPFVPDLETDRTQVDLDDDFRWEVRARWQLDDALYTPDQLAVSRTWRVLRKERDRVLDRVSGTYTAWLSYSVRARRGATNLKEAVLLALSVEEAEAQLDALTGGYFTRARRETLVTETPVSGAE